MRCMVGMPLCSRGISRSRTLAAPTALSAEGRAPPRRPRVSTKASGASSCAGLLDECLARRALRGRRPFCPPRRRAPWEAAPASGPGLKAPRRSIRLAAWDGRLCASAFGRAAEAAPARPAGPRRAQSERGAGRRRAHRPRPTARPPTFSAVRRLKARDRAPRLRRPRSAAPPRAQEALRRNGALLAPAPAAESLEGGRLRNSAGAFALPPVSRVEGARKHDDAAKTLGLFLRWPLSKGATADLKVGRAAFRRKTPRIWRIWPIAPFAGEVHDAVFSDGVWLRRKAVALIAAAAGAWSAGASPEGSASRRGRCPRSGPRLLRWPSATGLRASPRRRPPSGRRRASGTAPSTSPRRWEDARRSDPGRRREPSFWASPTGPPTPKMPTLPPHGLWNTAHGARDGSRFQGGSRSKTAERPMRTSACARPGACPTDSSKTARCSRSLRWARSAKVHGPHQQRRRERRRATSRHARASPRTSLAPPRQGDLLAALHAHRKPASRS